MIWTEYMPKPFGNLEIIVSDFESKKILYYDDGSNQIQDWARHALAYLTAGRPFCTWGNHGDAIPEAGMSNLAVPHIKDSTIGTGADVITTCPWQWSSANSAGLTGLVQVRSTAGVDMFGDPTLATGQTSLPIYSFFPTKMRFGTGGLDNNQLPLTNISTQATTLNSSQSTNTVFPFVVVDRTSTSAEDHIYVDSSNSIGKTTNRVTFSCTLPGGTDQSGVGNAYNGYVISEAGLFCDAAIAPIISGVTNFSMRTGLMFAYRTFYGIAKNASIDITFRWSMVF
jgi:hypothetical protein